MDDSRACPGVLLDGSTDDDRSALDVPLSDLASESRLVSIDIATGALTDVHAGAGVKMNPSPLPGNDIGYIRKRFRGWAGHLLCERQPGSAWTDPRSVMVARWAHAWCSTGAPLQTPPRLIGEDDQPESDHELSVCRVYCSVPAFSPSGGKQLPEHGQSPSDANVVALDSA